MPDANPSVPQADTLLTDDSRSRLEGWLAAQTGASRVAVTADGALGGAANRAITLDVADGPRVGRHACVLRAESAGRVSASIGKRREFAALSAAFQAGVLAPEPLFVCDDPAVLGPDFFIMRRVDGIGAGFAVVKGDAPQADLARALGRQLGRLHRLIPKPLNFDLLCPRVSAC
ncbi:phosphotransferase [Azospirillum sp.]|uniref:phosphotransferase n=1 Tax=Azospirillum sp. TaxID=34012 RepID=UPI00262C88FD|nr:phosphotransferase [Azospirillum sp.]